METARGTRRLAAVDLEGLKAGLFVGQKAAAALAIAPDLVTAEAEPEADAAALQALADWCVRFSPAVAVDPPDGLFLDITGVAHLWGGEEALLADLRRRLAANGVRVRAAIADTPGAAWALAHYGKPAVIAPPNGQADLLAYLPPAALRLEPEAAAQMERLGLKLLMQVIGLPRGPFARRFGAHAMMRLDQALGRVGEALAFQRPATPWFARLAFFEPISAPEDMERVSADVAVQLCARLEAKDQGAKRFRMGFHRVDGRVLFQTVGLALPGRDAARIAKLFAPKLAEVDPGFGIDAVTLEAEAVEPVSGRQSRLEAGLDAAVEDGIAPLVDRLTNRLGEGRVWRAAPVESHLPEQAVRRGGALAQGGGVWNPEAPRPLRLFRKPEPLEAVMAEVPDEPPRQFRWRKRVHRVLRAEGPERIGAEWWRGDIDDVRIDQVRDYYRVEDQDGARFWVFRQGFYTSEAPSWWLHGVFG